MVIAFFADFLAYGRDGIQIKLLIPVRRRLCSGPFAQHIKGKQLLVFRLLGAALKRLLHISAKNELAAHNFHGLVDGFPDHRLAHAIDCVADPVEGVFHQVFFKFNHLAGQHQPPHGSIDQKII